MTHGNVEAEDAGGQALRISEFASFTRQKGRGGSMVPREGSRLEIGMRQGTRAQTQCSATIECWRAGPI